MLIGERAGFGGEVVREAASQTIRRDSASAALAGSTRPRVVTLRKSTPLPPSMNTENGQYEVCRANISATISEKRVQEVAV